MSQIEKTVASKKLFRYAIDKHIKQDSKENMAFYRSNRWRYNTLNRVNFLKFLRLKGPLTFGCSFVLIGNYTWNFLENPAAH